MFSVRRTWLTALFAGFVLFFQFLPSSADGQVIPSLRAPDSISVFATFTDAKPNFRYYDDFAVYGLSVGGFIQTQHVLGFEVRGSLLRWGGPAHEESALGGVRGALHWGHFYPYADVLGGAANAWYWSNPPVKGQTNAKREEAVGPQWAVLGGIDIHMHHRINIRLGEFSYSKIYMKDRTLTPLSASAGIVFRLPVGR